MGFGLDLMILDIPDDLPVRHLSTHLQDAGTILLFNSDDLNLRAILRGFNNTYGFRVYREWMGINRLQMTSTKDKSTTVGIQPLAHTNVIVSDLQGFPII
jgi:hypothetical protein